MNHSIHHEPEADAAAISPGNMVTISILSLTFLLGLPGNALVIWVTGLKMKRTVNTVWFLNLAVADFLCCLSLPFNIAQVALRGQWYYGGFLCKVIPAAIIFNMFASVFILVAISVDRCLLVTRPVWAQNNRKVGLASGLCLGIWVLAFLMCVPVFMYRQTVYHSNGETYCTYNYGSDYGPTYDHYDYDYNESYSMETAYDADRALPDHQTDETSEDMTGHKMSDDLITITVFPNDTSAAAALNILGESVMITGMPTAIPHSGFSISSDSSEDSPNRTSLDTVPSTPSSSSDDTTLPQPLRTFKPGLNVVATRPPGEISTVKLSQLYSSQPDSDSRRESTQSPLTVTTITRLIFGFVVPLAVILVCYAFIIRRVRGAHFSKSSGKTLRVVFSIVSAFFICWAPYHIMGVILLYAESTTLFHLDNLSQGLAFTNSCINPVLYVFTGQDFKKKVRKSLRAVFESAFSEELTRSTAHTRSRNSADGTLKSTIL